MSPSLERICWTRMQAEAGQGLARIIARKEVERRAGDGLFFWGVGNAPPRAISALARMTAAIDVVFSVMKSKPKAHDMAPDRVLAWRRYVDMDGTVRAIPPNVLVTSRAGSRSCHYALMCLSDEPLAMADMGAFDPGAFRNFGAGKPVGSSQVTALLERRSANGPGDYRIAMRARLTGGLWVKLVDPVELGGAARAALEQVPGDEESWLDFVERIRSGERSLAPARQSEQRLLFAV